jgi:hypothetical protein
MQYEQSGRGEGPQVKAVQTALMFGISALLEQLRLLSAPLATWLSGQEDGTPTTRTSVPKWLIRQLARATQTAVKEPHIPDPLRLVSELGCVTNGHRISLTNTKQSRRTARGGVWS